MQFRNLTPHAILVCDERGNRVANFTPEKFSARIMTLPEKKETIGLIPIFLTAQHAVINLPEPIDNVGLIVSLAVRTAFPGRTDLFSPGELLRDDKGQPIGCIGLSRNY